MNSISFALTKVVYKLKAFCFKILLKGGKCGFWTSIGWASHNIILATLMLLTRVWFGLEFMWGFCFIFIHLLKKALWVIWTSNDDANWAAVWLLGTSLRVSCAPWQSLVWNRVLYQSKIIGQVWNRVLNHTFWSRVRVSRSVIYKPTQMVWE